MIKTILITFWTLKTIEFVLNTPYPLVAIISGSMRPQFNRGDILLIENITDINIFDVVVYKLPCLDKAIVHRVIDLNSDKGYLTKGDNNTITDEKYLYCEPNIWIKREQIYGRVIGQIPFIGYPKIWFNELIIGQFIHN